MHTRTFSNSKFSNANTRKTDDTKRVNKGEGEKRVSSIEDCCEETYTCAEDECQGQLKRPAQDTEDIRVFALGTEQCCTTGISCNEKDDMQSMCEQVNMVLKSTLPPEKFLESDLSKNCCENLRCSMLADLCESPKTNHFVGKEYDIVVCTFFRIISSSHTCTNVCSTHTKVQNLGEKESTCCAYDCKQIKDENCPGDMIVNENAGVLEPEDNVDKCCHVSTTCEKQKDRLVKMCPESTYTINEPYETTPFHDSEENIISTCCQVHNELFMTCSKFHGEGGLMCEEGYLPSRENSNSEIRGGRFGEVCCEEGVACQAPQKECPLGKFLVPRTEEAHYVYPDKFEEECCRDGQSCKDYDCEEGTLPRADMEETSEEKIAIETVQDTCCVDGKQCKSIEDLNTFCEQRKKIKTENADTDTKVRIV